MVQYYPPPPPKKKVAVLILQFLNLQDKILANYRSQGVVI